MEIYINNYMKQQSSITKVNQMNKMSVQCRAFSSDSSFDSFSFDAPVAPLYPEEEGM